jgi:hypothetical protein
MILEERTMEHKRILKVAASATLLLLTTVSISYAVDPITPDNETCVITNTTDVYVANVGHNSLTEDEKYSMTHNELPKYTVTACGATIFDGYDKEAIINYADSVMSIDGETHLTKSLKSDLGSTESPNFKTSNKITFTGASLTSLQKVEAGIKQVKGFKDYQTESNTCVLKDGACWDAAAGSSMAVSQVESTINTDLDITHSPYLHHNISAQGVGAVSSGMAMTLKEGYEPLCSGCSAMGIQGSGSTTQFDSHTNASGIFKFAKEQKSVINNTSSSDSSSCSGENVKKVP